MPSENQYPILKTCKTCKRNLPIENFYKNNQRKDGRTAKCAVCIALSRKDYDKKYNQTEKAKKNAKRYYHSEKGQKAKKDYRITYRDAHSSDSEWIAHMRELWKKYNKEKRYKEIQERYWQTPKGKLQKAKKDSKYQKTPLGLMAKKRMEKKRKYAIASSDSTLTLKEWEGILKQYDYRCAYCQKPLKLEMDHVIPLSKGGTHTRETIVPACRACNAKKGNKIPEMPVMTEPETIRLGIITQRGI